MNGIGKPVYLGVLLSGIFFASPLCAFAVGVTFEGSVASSVVCKDTQSFSITLSSFDSPVIFQSGFSKTSLPLFPPPNGTEVSGVLSNAVIPCLGSDGVVIASGRRVLYMGSGLLKNNSSSSVQSPRALYQSVFGITSTQGGGGSSASGSGSSGGGVGAGITSTLINSAGSLASDLLGKAASSLISKGLGTLSGALSGAVKVAGPFGGKILSPPIPCTIPPGGFEIILGPPNPGPYMYQAGVSQGIPPPLVPGQWVLGNAIPASCVIGVVPTPVRLITNFGASLPSVK